MNTFELTPAQTDRSAPDVPPSDGLGRKILLHNAHWFTRVRWIVVATFVLVGLAGHVAPSLLTAVGVQPPGAWPWALAAVATAANLLFCALVRRLGESSSPAAFRRHLWLQIMGDLLVVSAVVHIVGSVGTFIAFTYLFHIVLSCIFFSRRDSFRVTVVATCMYMACVLADIYGYGGQTQVFVDVVPAPLASPRVALLMAGSAVFVWFVVWYFAATLSQSVRLRDAALLAANRQLIEADEAQNRMVLRTVHDLKAPFAGIENNIQLLHVVHWDQTPEPVREIVERIAVRSRTLRERIRDILALGDLRSGRARPGSPVAIDLRALLNSIAEELSGKARGRGIALDVVSPELSVISQQKRLSILLTNIISNAISYSQEGGSVEVRAARERDGVCVCVTDHGIGIEPDALPHIFEEYYRTPQAAAFNRASTGLGLAIVKEIAGQLGLRIQVSSEHGQGTTFKVWIPHVQEDTQTGG